MPDRPSDPATALRLAAVVALVVLSVPVAAGYVGAGGADGGLAAPGTDGVSTVVTVDGTGPEQVVAFAPNGNVVYRNRTRDIYHDVDPSPAGDATVTYVASDLRLDADRCDGDGNCIRNVVERVNLTTGEVTVLYERYSPHRGSSQIHDVDRVNESVLLVGDIGPPDRVYMVNTTTGEVLWEWRVEEAFDRDSGGRYPGDWTHLNDVEYLDDGRVMVNLRNHDQVAFVDPGNGLKEGWTLGSDDDREVLYEAHNPDYIPADRGGPAVLVADSENNRVVEYQRTDDGWTRTWLWQDSGFHWPRDADRLPNGNTLVVDSHGQRLLEVDPEGEVVREQYFTAGGYDIERLGTGDESAGGPSMRAMRRAGTAEDANRTKTDCAGVDCVAATVPSLVPSLALHGLLFALPAWVTPLGGAALVGQALVLVTWAGAEAWRLWRERRR